MAAHGDFRAMGDTCNGLTPAARLINLQSSGPVVYFFAGTGNPEYFFMEVVKVYW